MNKTLNKRRNIRVGCPVPIDSQEGSLFDDTRTFDISKGGIGFVSPQIIPINHEITIELDLDSNGKSVFVIGKVRWIAPLSNSDRFRIGLSFERILNGSPTHLNKFLRERLGIGKETRHGKGRRAKTF